MIDPQRLTTIRNDNPERDYEIEVSTGELTCLCPAKPEQPDFCELTITYCPEADIIELKSLKHYLVSYRDVEIFHEPATNRILDDLFAAAQPRWMKVVGHWNRRGGLETVVRVEKR